MRFKNIKMAQDLKLEIFRITIKERYSKDDKILSFSKLFDKLETDDKENKFHQFLQDFIKFFDDKFQINKQKTKGISHNSDMKHSIRSTKNIIDFEFVGGNTGSEQGVYAIENSKIQVDTINGDKIVSMPFYVKLWLPSDYTAGILMIQSYTDYTISRFAKAIFQKFFAKYGVTLNIYTFIPKKNKDEFLAKSQVYELQVIKDRITKGKRHLINPIFTDFEKLKVTVSVTNFREPAKTFLNRLFGKRKKDENLIGSDLSDFDIIERDDYDMKIFYIDPKGRKANINISNPEEIKPTIFLDDDIKETGSERFDFEKIKEHTDGILEQIKEEIGYYAN